ncbi:serine hydrolase [Bacillus sp. DJP31]|uniref:serine hydrolase n=1 Tax=Bacillus sp. DJP31 TaxID=3409789 RepID=UPI003BB5FD90
MKERKISFLFYFCLVFSLVISTTFTNSRVAAESDILGVEAEAAILVDAKSGMILYEKNSEISLPTASMTKMMTEYLVLEALAEGKITQEQETGISDFVYQISHNRNLSNVPLRADGKYTVKELYEAMAIYSANGATIALAELVAGSETNFVKMMNEKAEELGLETYKFVNSTGLNNGDLLGQHPQGTKPDDENLMSAKSTAQLAFHLINDYPEVLETASIPKKVFREGTDDRIEMSNWNWMLPSLVYGYEGVDGLKTGTTDLAGFCFTGTAQRDGNRLIAVVMKSIGYEERFDDTAKLFNYGFSNYETQELFPSGYQIENQPSLPVSKGKEKTVEIESKEALSLFIKRGEKEEYLPKFKFDKETLTAPVEKGQKVGTLSVSYKGEELNFLPSEGNGGTSTDLITTTNVEKSNWFVLMMQAIGGFFADIWTSAADGIKALF